MSSTASDPEERAHHLAPPLRDAALRLRSLIRGSEASLVVLGILMSAVSLYYYLVLLKHIYVVDSKNQSRIITPTYLNVALGLVALAVVLLGVYPKPILELLNGLIAAL